MNHQWNTKEGSIGGTEKQKEYNIRRYQKNCHRNSFLSVITLTVNELTSEIKGICSKMDFFKM